MDAVCLLPMVVAVVCAHACVCTHMCMGVPACMFSIRERFFFSVALLQVRQ